MTQASLPDDCLLSILSFILDSNQRNNFSLASQTCWDLEASSRRRLKITSSVPRDAVPSLLTRFSSLTSLEINYLGWKPTSGPQINDDTLSAVASLCPKLKTLSLSFCGFITDSGLASVAQCLNLRSLSLNFLPRVTSRGLVAVAQGCPSLERLHVERCLRLDSARWLEAIGSRTCERVLDSGMSPADLEIRKSTTPSVPSSPSPFPSPSSIISCSTISTPDSSSSPLLLPLQSPLTPPPLALPSASSLSLSPFSLPALSTSSPQVQCKASPSSAVSSLTLLKCAGIREQDLALLGREGWENLEELRFEAAEESPSQADLETSTSIAFEDLAPDLDLQKLRILSLKDCPRVRQEGLGLVLSRLCSLKREDRRAGREDSWGLEELHLVNCPGLNDADIKQILGSFSMSLRVLSLSLMKWLVSSRANQVPAVTGATPAGAATPSQPSNTSSCPVGTLSEQEAMQQPSPAQQNAGGPSPQPHMQQSDRAVTTGSLEHIAQVSGLRHLELVCRDEYRSSAKLFQGFADSAITSLVSKLRHLETLSIGKGLHVTPGMLGELRQKHRGVGVREV